MFFAVKPANLDGVKVTRRKLRVCNYDRASAGTRPWCRGELNGLFYYWDDLPPDEGRVITISTCAIVNNTFSWTDETF